MQDGSLHSDNDRDYVSTSNNEFARSPPTLTTQARHVISPYLPPPMLIAMKSIDSNTNIKALIGDEASMTIFAAFFTIIIFGKSMKFLSFLSSGKAVEGLDDDEPEGHVLSELDKDKDSNGLNGGKRGPYDDSVVLFGPSHAGKTCLFHTLLSESTDSGDKKMPNTVMSLKADVSMVSKGRKGDNDAGSDSVRLIDYPGHVTLSSQLPQLLYPNSNSGKVRGLLVVDSTKSVSDAAMLLYNTVMINGALLDAWEMKNKTLHIMVVCNKVDVNGAKNWRRIKLQLRTELEKLKKISSTVSSADAKVLEENSLNKEDKRQLLGKGIDLDDLSKNGLSQIKVSFLSFSCLNCDGLEALNAFVKSGDVLTDNSSVLSRRKR